MLVIYHYSTEDKDCNGHIFAVSIFSSDDTLLVKYSDTNCCARASGFLDAIYQVGFARGQPEYQARNDIGL